MTLNKDAFADNHIKFVAGKPTTLKLLAVRQEIQNIGGNQVESVIFGVTEEDGKTVEKELSVTSKRLVNAMWAIVEKVDSGTETTIKIIKFGAKFDTYYEFCEVIDGKETDKVSTEKKK